MKAWLLCLPLLLAAGGLLPAAAIDPSIRQLVVGIAPGWDSGGGTAQFFERAPDGSWHAASGAIPVLYGKNGLAWGRGVFGTNETGLHKQEHDGRAPAGLFKIGTIYTYDAALPAGADYPFHQVTDADAWIDNPALPNYNRHVVIADPQHPPEWFDKMRMRAGDAAYRWLVEIRHNADPPEPGAGSAIFFHIRRGPNRHTSGCTTMQESDLVKLICWLRPAENPHYLLLPRAEYEKRWQTLGLPPPAKLAAMAP